MENTVITTSTTTPTRGSSVVGMSLRGCTTGSLAIAFGRSETVLRDRQDFAGLSTKGHVAIDAYVPGTLAWSPPIC